MSSSITIVEQLDIMYQFIYKNVKAQQQCGIALGRTIQLEQQYYV